MSGLFEQSEKINNIVFFGIMALSVLVLYISSLLENFRFWLTLFFLILLLSGIIFGFVSQNPKKSFLLGFLIWACIPLYLIIGKILSNPLSISDVFDMIPIISGCTFITGIISGSVGYFAAAEFVHPDKKWKIVYRIISTVLFLVLLYITALLYIFSTVDLF